MEQRVYTSFPRAPENLNGFYERLKNPDEKGKDDIGTGKKSKDKASKAIKEGKKKRKGKGDKETETRVYVGPSEVT